MEDKFVLAKKIRNNEPVDKIKFICDYCRGKKVLDLGCVRHSADYSLNDPRWLHKKISEVASSVLGVDYLLEEVRKLALKGYNIVYGDVTKELVIKDSFDVIVAGDLIEHLTNFDSFFQNILFLLKKDGVLIITTPNPFYADLFLYCAFKKNIIVNPEHTCFIDPITLSQLAGRYNLEIKDIHYIKDSWRLKNVIYENEWCRYDILNGKWVVGGKGNMDKGLTKNAIASWFFISLKRLFRSNDKLRRYILLPGLEIIEWTFDLWYASFKWLFGLNSKLVKYSDYLVVIRKL